MVGAVSLAIGVLLGLTGAVLALGTALTAPGGPAGSSASPRGLERLDAVVARVETASPEAHIVAVVAESDRIIRVDVRAAATGDAGTIRIARPSGAVTAVGMAPTTAWDVVHQLHANDFTGW